MIIANRGLTQLPVILDSDYCEVLSRISSTSTLHTVLISMASASTGHDIDIEAQQNFSQPCHDGVPSIFLASSRAVTPQ